MWKDEKSETKLNNKEYLSKVQDKYEGEIISRTVKENEEILDELLNTEEVLDIRTIASWKKGEKTPNPKNLKKLRNLEEYKKNLAELIKQIEEEYEKGRYYNRLVEGEIYEEVKLPAGMASDEMEFELKYDQIYSSLAVSHKELIKRVKDLTLKNQNDLQALIPLRDFLDFYEKYPNANFVFDQFFSKQYKLFSQLLNKEIPLSDFSTEIEKIIEVVYVKAEFDIKQ